MIQKYGALILLFCLSLQSCIDEYLPNLDQYNNYLVVDGVITNNPGPYEVKLSFSSHVYNPVILPYEGAVVKVLDNEDNEFYFQEVEPGIYSSSPDEFQGIVGRKYKLIINHDEKEYQSSWQELTDPLGIENVYTELEVHPTSSDFYTEYGYQFFVDSEEADTDSTYLMWRINGTYKYQADFLIWYIYDNHLLSDFPDHDSLFTCYSSDNISGIYTLDLSDFSTPVAKHIPLNFVSTLQRKLSIRYSLLVNQFSLTYSAYNYFNQLSELNFDQGELFDKQPYQVQGNVSNVNEEETVLGYFLVAGSSSKRIFVDRPPASDVKFYYDVCFLDRSALESFGFISYAPSSTWPLYVTLDENGSRALPSQKCVDCRKSGGSINKPDFWED